MKRIALLYSVVFGACVPSHALHVEPTHQRSWGHATAHVMASDAMSPECTASVAAGVTYMRGLGAHIELTFVDDDHPAIALEPRGGEISMRTGFTSSPDAIAETEVWILGGTHVGKAAIVYSACDPWIVAHETGHALGLEHSPDKLNVMYYSAAHRGWNIDSEQIRLIRVE